MVGSLSSPTNPLNNQLFFFIAQVAGGSLEGSDLELRSWDVIDQIPRFLLANHAGDGGVSCVLTSCAIFWGVYSPYLKT